jgi:DNA invertase Pin-like site-specific DNA recombinase
MATAKPATCAIWARVSTTEQKTEGQLNELRRWAADRGLEVVAEFITEDSAWTRNGNGAKGAEFDAKRADLLDGARLGRYQVILCWAVDRMSRRGAEDMLRFVRQLTDPDHIGCRLWSHEDTWVESCSDPMIREILFSVFATIARFESERRSARTRLAMQRPDVQAKLPGRKARGKDKAKTRRPAEGYKRAWTQERRDALAERNRQRAAETKPTKEAKPPYQGVHK